MTSERVEMAIFDFEMATMSAAHDMAGWSERAALKEARAALVTTIDAECEAERERCAARAIAAFGNLPAVANGIGEVIRMVKQP